jgi:hypothetical protein
MSAVRASAMWLYAGDERRKDSAATGIDGNQADDLAGGAGAVYVFR